MVDRSSIATLWSTRLFTARDIRRLTAIFVGFFLLLNASRQVLSAHVFPDADLGRLVFPVGVGTIRLPAPFFEVIAGSGLGIGDPRIRAVLIYPRHVAVAVVSIGLLVAVVHHLDRLSPPIVYAVGIVATISTTAIQGGYQGFVYPIAGLRFGERTHYYHDAETISSAARFVADFHAIQPDLTIHAQTHPPGAVLVYYAIQQVSANPVLVGTVLLLVSMASVFYIHSLVEAEFGREVATITTAVFAALPAVQVYYYSTLDAVIAFVVIASIAHYVSWQSTGRWRHLGLSIGFVTVALSLTFLGVFTLGIVGLHQLERLWRDRTVVPIRDGMLVVSAPIALVVAVSVATGFDYFEALLAASATESAYYGGGIYALSSPVSYVATRIEGVAELVLFLGPFATVLVYRGARLPATDTVRLGRYGILVTLGLFLAGTPHTGEAARILLFLYPLLLLFVANYFHHHGLGIQEGRQLLGLVWLQAVAMQLFGSYLW